MVISFHPTLFALPFVVNKLMPEALSRRLLRSLFPNRTDTGFPKFHAYYSGCYCTNAVRDAIRKLGFREVEQVPFYTHSYYQKIPLARNLHRQTAKLAAAHNLALLAAFCYTAAVK